MERKKPTPDVLKQAISDLQEPVIFQNIINDEGQENSWTLLSFEKLKDVLGDMPLSFRTGKNSRTKEPQWDLNCPIESMTLSEFLDRVENSPDWYYFDYKYMHQWFLNKPEVLSAVDWRAFGFDKTGEDSTLWIGSKGAHTNCHQDSYGCNLVAQIHGRKQWLLFPPDSGKVLQETRVPYEESTIYSKFNFFCPSKSDEESLEKIDKSPISIILKPGDVLFVPKGWWHFVESLDLSISVNVWLPLASDCQARLKEVLVKLVMEKIGDCLPAVRDEVPYDLGELMQLIKKCIKDCVNEKNELPGEPSPKKMRKISQDAGDLAEEYKNFVKKLNYLSKEEFRMFLARQRGRFPETKCDDSSPENSDSAENTSKNVADAFCHPDVIDRIVDILLNNN